MSRRRLRPFIAVLGAAAILGLGAARIALSQGALPAPADAVATPTQLLTTPTPPELPNAAQVERGRYLVVAGDCVSCHTREGAAPLSGGYGLTTPFGTIYSPNLTSDGATGIGNWTPDQFWRAMREGVGVHGERLYPAFPYPYFTEVSRADSDALLAYLKTTPAVSYTPPANRLPFPLNIRFLMRGWNLLFFKPHAYPQDGSKSAQWNRGAYLVTGLGHCGACHTPKNALGADDPKRPLRSGLLDNWIAPDLTGNPRRGLGSWSPKEIVAYLKTGRNDRAAAGGAMAEVVSYSTSLMSDRDLAAIAAYLKDRPASPASATADVDPGATDRGAAIYSDACASCHLTTGAGQPGYFPPMKDDTMAQQTDPSGLLHLILAGARTGPTPTRPTPLSMPSFAWKLSDAEIADVSTYVRNAWGNRAPPVSQSKAADIRRKLELQTEHLTVNSGDHGTAD